MMKIKVFGSAGLINKLFVKGDNETADQLYEKSQDLFRKGNTADGYVYLQASALKGHAEAAFQMATAIAEKKTFGNMEDAVKYYTIASDHNHAYATTNLATCYQMGTGVDVDHIKAIHLLNKATMLGDEMAIFNLAQTYLLGYGVKQDEQKGWEMLESLAAKGNEQAIAYMKDMRIRGYNPPNNDNTNTSSTESPVKKISKDYAVDHAPECVISDSQIMKLYDSVKNGDESAREELMDLGGNQMNRDAMNALRKLGLITEDISEDFKRGTIEYIANAWKTYNVEPLYIVCAWTYPGFIYREFNEHKIEIYRTSSEVLFIERIANEMSECRKRGIVPRFRLRQVDSQSSFCIDVLIQTISLSTFYLDIQDGHFVGIFRVYDGTNA